MSYIQNIMKEEHQRLQALYQKYMDKIDSLPNGVVSIKKHNKREHLYLASRRNGEVKFDYIGSVASDNARKILEQDKFRKDYELKLRQVKGDLKEIERVLRGKKRKLLTSVLKELQAKGVLDGLVIAGGWCQYYYSVLFDNAPEIPLLRTLDIDFLVPNPSKFKTKVDVSQLLNQLGFDRDVIGDAYRIISWPIDG